MLLQTAWTSDIGRQAGRHSSEFLDFRHDRRQATSAADLLGLRCHVH